MIRTFIALLGIVVVPAAHGITLNRDASSVARHLVATPLYAMDDDSCPDVEAKLAALRALKSMDSTKIVPVLKKLFARRDECSLPLRRTAISYGLIPRVIDAETEELIVMIVSSEPDLEIRRSAIQMLRNDTSEKAVQGLQKALNEFEDQQTQQEALSILSKIQGSSARKALKNYIENDSTPEDFKSMALQQLTSAYSSAAYTGAPKPGELSYTIDGTPRQVTSKDSSDWEGRIREIGTYLREVFPKLPSEALKRSVTSSVSAFGGADNAKWLFNVAIETKEPIEIRREALRTAAAIPLVRPKHGYGSSSTSALALGIEDLVKGYDKLEDRQMKSELLTIFARRTEDAAFLKIASIAKDDKDKNLRQDAIRYLSSSKDPRAAKALSDVLDKE